MLQHFLGWKERKKERKKKERKGEKDIVLDCQLPGEYTTHESLSGSFRPISNESGRFEHGKFSKPYIPNFCFFIAV